jgi:Septum formation/Bacterial SH3 domain
VADDDQAKSDDTAPGGDAKSASPKPAKATKRKATGKSTPKKAATDKTATDKRGSATGSGEPFADDTEAVEVPEGDATAPVDRVGGEDAPTQRLDPETDATAETASASGAQTDTTSPGPASQAATTTTDGAASPSLGSCPECGRRLVKSGQRFCTRCRARLSPDLKGTIFDPGAKRAWAFVAVVVVLLVIGAAATSGGNSTPISNSTFPTTPSVDNATTPDTQPSVSSPQTTTATVPPGVEIPNSQLAPGDCFAFPGQPNAVNNPQAKTRVDKVPCDGLHPFETVAVLMYPGAATVPFPGTDTLNTYAQAQCTPLYTSYTSSSSLSLSSTYFYPSDTSWPSGDRTVVCAAHDSSGQLLSTPIGGSTAPATPTTQSGTINGDNVNVRPSPDTGGQLVTTLNTNAQVSILCSTNGESVHGNNLWDKVTVNNQTGYVSDLYVNHSGTASSC